MPEMIPNFNGTIKMSTADVSERARGRLVELSGRVTQKRASRFMTIRDQFGSIQLVAPTEELRMESRFNAIPVDSHIVVVGHVEVRPNAAVNGAHENGAIEVHVRDILTVRKPKNDAHSSGTARNVAGTPQNRQFSTSAGSDQGSENRGVTASEHRKTRGFANIQEAFQNRRRTCAELRSQHVGEIVELCGWIDEGKKSGRFMQLRDGRGSVQVVIDLSNLPLCETFAKLSESDVVLVKGIVVGRPEHNRNTANETGDVEISVWDCNVIEGESNSSSDTKTNAAEPKSNTTTIRTNSGDSPNCNLFTNRTHTCGELRPTHVGQKVTLCGWLEFERMKKFLTLRDGYGSIQVLVPPRLADEVNVDAVPFESIIEIQGSVVARPEKFENTSMITGNVEVLLSDFKVLNTARKNLPVEVRNFNRAKETLRLENRYVDLRFSDMQNNLRTRSSVLMKMREYLVNDCGFVEVETPTLFRRTPGVSRNELIVV